MADCTFIKSKERKGGRKDEYNQNEWHTRVKLQRITLKSEEMEVKGYILTGVQKEWTYRFYG